MGERSAGLLLVRREDVIQVLLVHMGGPFWARKDERAWSVPKGVVEPGEDLLAAARREFREELGIDPPDVTFVELGTFRYSSGKQVTVFAGESDLDLDDFSPGTFELEWPPRSGRREQFPEVDRAAWVSLDAAERLLVAGQAPVVGAVTARWLGR